MDKGPGGWTPEVARIHDDVFLQPPEESDLTPQEIQAIEDAHQEELYDRWKERDL